MAIPLLEYTPVTQNVRVEGYEIGGDEKPTIYTTENCLSYSDTGNLIEAAYRQIFFHAFKYDRETFLESQLRNGQITVRDFIRGLLVSETYITSFYEKNSNYRFVEQTVQRVLGRDVYSQKEKIAWSIVVATKGYKGFFDALLESDEYLSNFGYDTVPYQRRRVLPGREAGETPFNIKSPRYDAYHRGILGFPQIIWQNQVRRFVPQEKQAKAGDPSLYLNMAKGLNSAKGKTTPTVNAQIDYLSKVPKR
ncbi:MAG: phycobilisome rod-core linker polypeptide [Microcystaceae cyanobacterium]